jgi:putative transposase
MPNYRRVKSDGGTFFFTVVTCRRQKFLTRPECRRTLRNAIAEVKQTHPFHIDAWVLLPDHMHCIWTLPKNDAYFSKR